MLFVGDDAAIEQLDVAIHARGQCEIVVTAATVLPCLSTSSRKTSNTCSLACESSDPVG